MNTKPVPDSHHILECELWVPAAIDEVWTFASNPRNLAGISPPLYNVRVPEKAQTKDGERVHIAMSPLGLPITLKWISLLQNVVATGDKRQFVDVQEKGPFGFWKHTHSFTAGSAELKGERSLSNIKLTRPGTWIRDHVEYDMPFGVLGSLAHSLMVRRSLTSMFAYRRKKLAEYFQK